jgi:uncharacterized protein
MRLTLVVAASLVGGAINAMAGGGTLLTFPALVGLGIAPLTANATSTVALWPASVSSMWGYREPLRGAREWVVSFALPSVAGGLIGALLLIWTPAATFSRIVPWLVLGATGLFMTQGTLTKWLRRHSATSAAVPVERSPSPAILGFQFLIAIYGGYFGAGVGILMLAGLGFMGLSNIHRMNGLKNCGGLCMNAVAAAAFAVSGLVNWPVALAMAFGSFAGGYTGSRLAQRIGQRAVRSVIVLVGFSSGIWLMVAH